MLGDNIVRIRKLKEMSASDCAKKIGISRGYFHDIENNIKKNPSIEMLERIALVLEVPASELLSTEEKLEIAKSSLKEINDTVNDYYVSKDNVSYVRESSFDDEINLLINKIEKLSIKERKIVEVLVDQLLTQQ